MAFNKENLKVLFVQLCGAELIRYISPDMDTPVYCLYDKFFRILNESDIYIIKRRGILDKVNSFHVVKLDLIAGSWEVVEMERTIDTRPVHEKFSMDKKVKQYIRDKQGKGNKKFLDKMSAGIRKAKEAFMKRDGEKDIDNQNPTA